MALRVLLADESSTIKKVFQLALQDFAVEVKPVNVGLDVTAVAETFKPDIIFADVLLQKKNGYDVSLEIKQNSGLNKTPVVLMWSGFMDLDEDKMQASGADAQLEKPFDVKSLRALVQSLVPKTKEQTLSSYLSFPKLPDFEENRPKETKTAESSYEDASNPPPIQDEEDTDSEKKGWSMDSFDPPIMPGSEDEFQELNLKSEFSADDDDDAPLIPPDMDIDKDLLSQDSDDEDSSWQQKDLGRYTVGEDSLLGDESEPDIKYIVPDSDLPPTPMGTSTSIDADYDLEIEIPEGDGAPSGLSSSSSGAPVAAEESFVPPGRKKGKTVVLNFSLDGEGEAGDASVHTGTGLNPTSMLREINAQLNEEAIAEIIRTQAKDIIEEQARKVIEDVVWKVIPDLARQIVEREVKKLVDEDEVELS